MDSTLCIVRINQFRVELQGYHCNQFILEYSDLQDQLVDCLELTSRILL